MTRTNMDYRMLHNAIFRIATLPFFVVSFRSYSVLNSSILASDAFHMVPQNKVLIRTKFVSASVWPKRQQFDVQINPDVYSSNIGNVNAIDTTTNSRRELFYSMANIGTAILLGLDSFPTTANAATSTADDTTVTTNAVPMKTFVDPEGLFILNLPQRFFAIRRTNQGDLPNAKTGSGRRGSSIFNAGDLAKAEVLAVERFPTRVLLEEYGIEATGSLKTFPEIGEPSTIANLIIMRRDREKPIATSSNGSGATGSDSSKSRIVPGSLLLSADGRELSFALKTNIDVQKPDLLMEQSGISVLNRITAAKVSLQSNDGYILAVFASALETDWQGPDGAALQVSVNSFQAIDQANGNGGKI